MVAWGRFRGFPEVGRKPTLPAGGLESPGGRRASCHSAPHDPAPVVHAADYGRGRALAVDQVPHGQVADGRQAVLPPIEPVHEVEEGPGPDPRPSACRCRPRTGGDAGYVGIGCAAVRRRHRCSENRRGIPVGSGGKPRKVRARTEMRKAALTARLPCFQQPEKLAPQ